MKFVKHPEINEIELTFTFALYWSEDFLTTEITVLNWTILSVSFFR